MLTLSSSAYQPPGPQPPGPLPDPPGDRTPTVRCDGARRTRRYAPAPTTGGRGKCRQGLPLLMVALVIVGPLMGSQLAGPIGRVVADEPPSKQRVTLTIDYGDGCQKSFTQIPWASEMTVQGAMRHAERHPRAIKVMSRGSGSTALLTQIDDLKNEGNGRNWIFRVNGKLGDRSYAVYPLKAGDTILWRFETYEGDDSP
jgi:hypothetical protein